MNHLADIRRRLWLWATLTALVFTVLVGGVGVVGGEALAATQQDSCCCNQGDSAKAAQGKSHHQKMEAGAGCHDRCAEHGCTCHIAPQNSTPSGQTLALSNSTVSFAPALAAQDSVQIRLPKPRAPGKVRPTAATKSPSPPQPLFLLHQTLLI